MSLANQISLSQGNKSQWGVQGTLRGMATHWGSPHLVGAEVEVICA